MRCRTPRSATLMARTEFDVAVLHDAPPDRNGECSFGIACDMPGRWCGANAARRVAFINQRCRRCRAPRSIPSDAIGFRRADRRTAARTAHGRAARERCAGDDRAAGGGARAGWRTIQSGIGDTPAAAMWRRCACIAGCASIRGSSRRNTCSWPMPARIDPGAEQCDGRRVGRCGFL